MQEIPHTKLPKQHHDKKTVDVKVYQDTNIDAQSHITDKKRRRISDSKEGHQFSRNKGHNSEATKAITVETKASSDAMGTTLQPEWLVGPRRKALKYVLKWEIQSLLQRLAEIGEETVLLTADLDGGYVGQMGSDKGQGFMASSLLREVKAEFLSFCTGTCAEDVASQTNNRPRKKQHKRSSEEATRSHVTAESGHMMVDTCQVTAGLQPHDTEGKKESHDALGLEATPLEAKEGRVYKKRKLGPLSRQPRRSYISDRASASSRDKTGFQSRENKISGTQSVELTLVSVGDNQSGDSECSDFLSHDDSRIQGTSQKENQNESACEPVNGYGVNLGLDLPGSKESEQLSGMTQPASCRTVITEDGLMRILPETDSASSRTIIPEDGGMGVIPETESASSRTVITEDGGMRIIPETEIKIEPDDMNTQLQAMERVKKAGKKRQYDPKVLELAYWEVTLGGKSIHGAAKMYHIPDSTLRDRFRSPFLPAPDGDQFNVTTGPGTLFTHQEENNLVRNVMHMSTIGYDYCRSEFINLATDYAISLGKRGVTDPAFSQSWYLGFMRRHPELPLIKPQKLARLRANCSSDVLDRYFMELATIMNERGLMAQPGNIWNIDEIGLLLEHSATTVAAGKNTASQTVTQAATQAGTSNRSQNVTIIAAGSVAGASVPPFYVFPRGTTDDSMLDSASPGAAYTVSDSGWSNSLVYREYLVKHFRKHVPKSDTPQLLLLDGHKSHVNLTLKEWGESEKLLLFVIPPHTSHVSQPQDSDCLCPLKTAYRSECQTFLNKYPGIKIDQHNVAAISSIAYLKSTMPDTLVSAFRKTGIYPLQRDQMTPTETQKNQSTRAETPGNHLIRADFEITRLACAETTGNKRAHAETEGNQWARAETQENQLARAEIEGNQMAHADTMPSSIYNAEEDVTSEQTTTD